MPALHKIDNDNKLIITTWHGEASDSELIDALSRYRQDIKSQPGYCSYNDIVDFSRASSFALTASGLRKLVVIAAGADVRDVKTRLAIIVSEPVAFGLGRMYEAYRSFVSPVPKEVRVFKNYADALEWIVDDSKHSD